MAEVKIVFETLYEILRREKYKNELQQLEPTFYNDVVSYLAEKASVLESQQSKSNIFASGELQKTQKTVENVKKILKELYERRESKIIQLARMAAMMGETAELHEILPEERSLFREIRDTLNKYRAGILVNVLEMKLPKIEETEKPKELKSDKKLETKLVRFLNPTPKFIGDDLNVYGPYDEEDMAALPNKVANVLIKKNRVEAIK
jgi:DNA replication initiation complex subunit (GINS family)